MLSRTGSQTGGQSGSQSASLLCWSGSRLPLPTPMATASPRVLESLLHGPLPSDALFHISAGHFFCCLKPCVVYFRPAACEGNCATALGTQSWFQSQPVAVQAAGCGSEEGSAGHSRARAHCLRGGPASQRPWQRQVSFLQQLHGLPSFHPLSAWLALSIIMMRQCSTLASSTLARVPEHAHCHTLRITADTFLRSIHIKSTPLAQLQACWAGLCHCQSLTQHVHGPLM